MDNARPCCWRLFPAILTNPRLTPDGAGRGRFMPCVALCGPPCGVLWCGNIGTLPDTKTALRARKRPLRRFCVLASPLPCWTRAQNSRLEAVERRASGWKVPGSIGARADTLEGLEGTKNRPRIDQGRKLRYSRFFRCLPDNHQGKD